MTKRKISLKFLALFCFFLLLSILSRVMYLRGLYGIEFFSFIVGLLVFPAIYFLLVSFSKKDHRWRSGIILITGYVLFRLTIYYGEYDIIFWMGTMGTLLSSVFILITFFNPIKRWLIY